MTSEQSPLHNPTVKSPDDGSKTSAPVSATQAAGQAPENKSSASERSAAQKPEQKKTEAEAVATGGKLAEMPTPARDINHKISSLDGELHNLRAELAATNASVEEGLDRLGDSDTDLNAKVSETYKRLGEIDNAYKSLLQISTRIDQDIRRLNGDVSEVARESANGIRHLEQSTLAQSSQFAQQNQELLGRLNSLADDSRQTSELLREKIEQTTHSLLAAKQELLAEIDRRSEQVASRLESQAEKQRAELDEAIDNNRARILKLQSVDEAIIKRATSLEITSAELEVQARQMQSSIEQLQSSNNQLYAEVTELKVQANALQIQSRRQDSQLDALEMKSRGLGDGLAELGALVDRHFYRLSAALLLLFGFVLILYFLQQAELVEGRMAAAGQSRQVSEALAENQAELKQDMAVLASDMAQQLRQQTESRQQAAGELQQLVQSQLASIEDRLGSVEGRLLNESPFSAIGDDNIIHGEHWLLQQSPENYSVQVAVLDSPQAAYELAADYHYYLKQKLSMFRVGKQGRDYYVLLSGIYPQAQQAQMARSRLPARLRRQGGAVVKLGDIQQTIRM